MRALFFWGHDAQDIRTLIQFLGVMGDPIAHSRSPRMHNAALQEMGLDWVYLPFRVEAANLSSAVKGLWSLGCRGFSVTIPHKEKIMPFLAGISPTAQQVGAVNTVVRTKDGWWGTNTDVAGFVSVLQNRSWQGTGALILGTGGAARAALVGCQHLGCMPLYIWGRSTEKLNRIQRDFPMVQPLKNLTPETLGNLQLVVNTTPLGMAGTTMEAHSALSSQQLSLLPPTTLVYDLVYNPQVTVLLKLAQERGLAIQGGLRMLVTQGAVALELWTEQPVPIEAMALALT